jgi:hypothetical protein
MQNTDDGNGWLELLSSLTDDELHRYGEIAAHQRRIEWQHGWAQMLCVAGSVASMGWFAREYMANGLTWDGGAIAGLAAVLAYWPYRKAIVRRLWGRHCRAVARETAQRRAAQGNETG